MSFARSVRISALVATACTLGAPSMPALAGARPQVDLSVSVTTAPAPFVPGGIGTVTMTVYNVGPETAGATLPNQRSIIVYEKPYDVVGLPPPFLFFEPAVGCSAYTEFSEYIPGLPGGGITLLNSYHFDSIAAGESRTCTYRIEFLPTTQESFATSWRVHTTNDDDINADNNRFDYSFVVAPSQASIPVPTLSAISLLILSVGLLFAVASTHSRGQQSCRCTSPSNSRRRGPRRRS